MLPALYAVTLFVGAALLFLVQPLVGKLLPMVVFLVAPDITWVIAARIVQGLATGFGTSAFSAAIPSGVKTKPEPERSMRRAARLKEIPGRQAPPIEG